MSKSETIKITPAAAQQIKRSAKEGNMEDLAMRIAATRNPDGSIHYAMGFDDSVHENDTRLTSSEINLVIAPHSIDLLSGVTIDYVEMDADTYQFIFLNPNDPNYIPPTDTSKESG